MKPSISDSEWQILKVLWERSPLTLPEILCALKETGWSNTTIQTFLSRLVKKGAVATERRGKGYLYTPVVAREACQTDETKAFVDRVFDGSLKELVLRFAKDKLSDAELEELKRLVDRGTESGGNGDAV
jgi:BlaI family penicillinase repressor